MKRTIVAGICVAATLVSAGSVRADGDHIADIAGDANGLNAIGIEQDTRPASYDPADLVGVGIETAYETVPAPGGVRHVPTALVVRFRTTATPTVPDAQWSSVYRVDTTIDGLTVHLETVLFREEAGAPAQTLPLIHEEEMCPQGVGFCNIGGGREGWTAEITDGGLVTTYPFDALTERELELIGPGSVLGSPSGATAAPWFIAGAAGTDIPTMEHEGGQLIDATDAGADFVVASDVPSDA